MTESPYPWDLYALQQAQLNNRTKIDDTTWGLEAGLDLLLVQDDPCLAPDNEALARKIASVTRRSRYARSLLAKYVVKPALGGIDECNRLEARSALNALERKMEKQSHDLLLQVANGADRIALAADQGINVGALRARVARARVVARRLVA